MPPIAPHPATLELRIAAKCFGARPVLHDVGFAAHPGEVLALLGASGAGKSTTLRIALGIDVAFTGTVRRAAGRLGVVFQEPRLLPWLSAADNLRLVAPELSADRIAALLAETGLAETGLAETGLAETGLAGVGALRPAALSLGMARRVALARALAVDPVLLVLDEPFASLDPQMAATLALVVLRRARQAATAVLLATHDLPQALAIADRVLVLAGSPATLQADIACAAHPDRAALRGTLLARFPFLTAAGGTAD